MKKHGHGSKSINNEQCVDFKEKHFQFHRPNIGKRVYSTKGIYVKYGGMAIDDFE